MTITTWFPKSSILGFNCALAEINIFIYSLLLHTKEESTGGTTKMDFILMGQVTSSHQILASGALKAMFDFASCFTLSLTHNTCSINTEIIIDH
jgi:hypothetical protein